ncbi:MAG: S1 RNA-binding domain-containing protein [Anaerolineae bacterium]|nr:S1 RNA-binding domain-containing protein [Anaerolineae bacterium]
MLYNEESVHQEGEVPEIDEGWWAAVLADESLGGEPARETSIKFPPEGFLNLDWEKIQAIHDNDEIISLEVKGYNRGGLLVQDEDVQGFVPISHLVDMPSNAKEEDRVKMLPAYVGKVLQLKVIECEPGQDRVVFSERAALAGEGRRLQLFQSLQEGDRIQGTVTNVTEFGVFVDLGGVEGLIHVSELSWGRVQHPRDILQVGNKIDVLVLQVSEESSRVALSYKRLHSNPWEQMLAQFQLGDEVNATITSITRFGVFARLDVGVEGLIHVSSIPQHVDKKRLEEFFRPGQKVQAKILHIDAERRRLGLGLVEPQ